MKLMVSKYVRTLGLLALTPAIGLLTTVSAKARALGIDSDFNCCSVNWTTAANNGIQFACIKATAQDQGFQNNVFGNRMQGAQSAGIYTIPYNRVNPSLYSPSSEASYFWNFAAPYINAGGLNLSPAVDIEDGLTGSYKLDNGSTTSNLATWINQYFSDLSNDADNDGVKIVQLTYANVGRTCSLGSGLHGSLWLADPCGCDPSTGSPYTCGGCTSSDGWDGCEPTGSESWSIWQYAWDVLVPGPTEHVDEDVYNGSLSSMVSAFATTTTFGGVSFKPSPILYANGHENVFALQYTGYAPWSAHNTGGPTNSWTETWIGNGGQFTGSSTVVPALNLNGYLEVFSIGTSGNDFMHASNTGEGTSFGSWSVLGSSGYVGNPAVIEDPANGRVEVYTHNSPGGSIQRFYHIGFSGAWTNESLGGSIGSDPTAIINANGYYNVFAVDGSGNLVNRWNTGPGTAWDSGGWQTIGTGCAGRPAIIVRDDGGVEVFVRRASDNTVNHYYHGGFTNAWNSGNIGGSTPNAIASNLSVIENTGRQIEVFGITSGGGLWHASNSGPGTSWSSWSQITTGGTALFSDPAAIVNTNSSAEVFVRILNSNQVGHIWNSGPGTSWGSLSLFNGPQ